MSQLKVRDLMSTDVVTLDENEDLDLAGQLMYIARIRHLPVVSEGRFVGLVTNRDLLRLQASQIASAANEEQRETSRWVKAGWVMQREVHSVEADSPVLEAARIMRQHKYGCLPVVDAAGKLEGILTESDFVDYVIRQLEDPSS